jgi:Kef-type K+ transport system membrane component KefB
MTAASSVHATEQLLFFTLLQLVVIVLAARLGGLIAKRCGQAVAVGEIVTGILLGPSLFGALAPETFAWVFKSTPPQPLNILSQVGLLLLMFQIGLEFDFAHLREKRNRRAVMAVSAAGLILPFALGLALALALPPALVPTPNRLGFSLFVATAFSITALPILGRIMMEFGLTRTPLGVIAISAAAINDVVGWLLLALVTALSTSGLDSLSFAGRVLAVLAFAALCWFGVRPLLIRFVRAQMPNSAASGGSSEVSQALSPNLMGVLIASIFMAGMCTFQLGIFAIFGGFMMGVLLHTEQAFVKAWNDKIGTFVNVFFLPIFFTYTGLRTDIGSLASGSAWGWCALLIALATLGKFGGCWLAARWAGLDAISARLIGVMMNTRALMELIIINVGFELGLIGKEVFTMLVLMAIFSTVITTPFLRRWLPLLSASPPQHQPKSPLLQADAR